MKIKDYVRYSMQLAHIGPRKTHSTNAKNYVLRPVPAIYLPPQLNHPMSVSLPVEQPLWVSQKFRLGVRHPYNFGVLYDCN